jgi:hypothetical protein
MNRHALTGLALVAAITVGFAAAPALAAEPAPAPLVAAGNPVPWWFAYKFASDAFPSDDDDPARACPFGGDIVKHKPFSQRYAFASQAQPVLQEGPGLIGTSSSDPLGATFAEIYTGAYYFVAWNDQFYGDPPIDGPACDAKQCGKPWGHSKGILAWNEGGEGVVIQVTTPSWPASGTQRHPRADGNTLGCVSNDNNITNAQHFFALKLDRDDLKLVLKALDVASVVTDIDNPQIANLSVNGAPLPPDLAALVAALKKPAPSPQDKYMNTTLSTGVRLIAKPSGLHVPSWQFVSSVIGGAPLRTATWWAYPTIPSTKSATSIGCWSASLPKKPGRVDIATTGHWKNVEIGLKGGPNHAKIGVSVGGAHNYVIFGDLNQQGQLSDAKNTGSKKCTSSQNMRGGMFFVIEHKDLADGVRALISGKTAPYAP